MTTDTQTQLHEAISCPVTDWHPPITVWIWILIGRTSAAILVLQVVLHWLGIWSFAHAPSREGRMRWAWVMLLVGMTPIALTYIAVIQKDTLLASFFLAAFGLSAILRRSSFPVALDILGALCR